MKAILEFNLPEEHAEHIRAVHAMDAWAALDEIRNIIRNHLKYGVEAEAAILITNIQQSVFDAESLLGE